MCLTNKKENEILKFKRYFIYFKTIYEKLKKNQKLIRGFYKKNIKKKLENYF